MSERIPERITYYVNLEPLKKLGKEAWYYLDLYAQAKALQKKKPGKRKDFSKSVKIATLAKQFQRCKSCRKLSYVWDYHHKNGNRSDNREINCEALCPTCHAKKTRKKL